MKAVARSYMWWPGMDRDLENLAKSCTACQLVKSAAPLHPWLWPDQPWQRIHIDYAGSFRGKMFLLLVDAHSKWPEIFEMASSTSESTIAMLRQVFAAYGLPEHLVSDNEPQLHQRSFNSSCVIMGLSTSEQPLTILLQMVPWTFRQSMKAREQDGFILQHQLQNFLIKYRSTPHATMGQSPASLFLGRPLRTRVDLLRPVVEERVRGEQARQKHHHDAHGRYREFPVGTPVMMREGRHKCHWLPGTVRERHRPISYLVEMESGVWCHKHIDHLREIAVASQPQPAKPTPEVAPVPCESIPTSPLVESSDSSSEVGILIQLVPAHGSHRPLPL